MLPFIETSGFRRTCRKKLTRAIASAALICSPVAMPAAQVPITWQGGTGNWNTAGSWDPAVVPNNGADTYLVSIDGGDAGNSVVTLNIAATVDGVTLDAGDTLAVGNIQTLTIATDAVTNNGRWELNQIFASGNTRLQFTVPVTLQGSGEWVLSNNFRNVIGPLGGTTTLNAAATIRGSGSLEMGIHQFVNQGLIRQEDTNSFTILNGAGGFLNPGALEAAGSGGLLLQGGAFDNNDGTITALDGSFVQLGPDASFDGGILATSGSGQLRVEGADLAGPIISDITLQGALVQNNLEDARIRGTITNEGTWTIAQTFASGNTNLTAENNAILTGSGELVIGLNQLPRLMIDNTTFTHETNHLIRGTGQILAGDGTFVNKGTIRHTGGNSLTLSSGAGSFSNQSVIESVTAAGALRLYLTNGTFVNSPTGVIRSTGTGITQIGPGANVSGGALSTADSGVMLINSASQQAAGDAGVPILTDVTFSGLLNHPAFQAASVRGTLTNHGEWNVFHNGGSGSASVYLEQGALVTGAGNIFLSGNTLGRVMVDDSTVTHDTNHTIRGGGQINVADNGSLVNRGTIRQEGTSTLTVGTGVGASLKNESLMEAAGTAALRLITATVDNDGGTMRALDGASFQIGPAASVSMGTLETVGTGLMNLNSSSSATGDNVPILEDLLINGNIRQQNLQSAIVRGTVENNGLWTNIHDSATNVTDIILEQGAVLDGEGEIFMTGAGALNGRVITDGTVAIHEADHTIRGRGKILDGTGGMINRGTIRQEGVSSLTVAANELGLVNDGFLQSNGAGGLILTNGPVTNNLLIEAQDGGLIQIGPSGSITGGTISSVGSGLVAISGDGGNAPLLDGVVLNAATSQPNLQDVRLRGTITNNGSWNNNQLSGSSSTDVILEQSAVLTGNGEIFLSGAAGAGNGRVITDGTTAVQEAGHTIRGAGRILDDTGSMVNRGTIRQEGVSNLTVNPDDAGLTNESLLASSGTGRLVLTDGTFTNHSGDIHAMDGGIVQVGPQIILEGGNLFSMGSGVVDIVGDGSAAPTLVGVTTSGTITQNNLQDVRLRGNTVNNSQWTLNHISLSSSTIITLEQSATLSGTGSIHMSGNTLGRIHADGTVGIHEAGHTIRGGGRILEDTGGLINRGIIRQEGTTSMTVDPNELGLTNEGLLASNGNGGLILTNGSFLNSAGDIHAEDGGIVRVGPLALVEGGTLRSSDTGVVSIIGGGGNQSTFSDLTLAGTVSQGNLNHVTIDGIVINNSNWTTLHTSLTNDTVINLVDGSSLLGAGMIEFTGTNTRTGLRSSGVVTNGPDHTLAGAGQVLAGTGSMLNLGTVRADGGTMILEPGEGGFLNSGLIHAVTANSMRIVNGARFTNDGDVEVEDGGVVQVQAGNYNQTGGWTQLDGTMTLSQSGSRAVIDGGVLAGSGVVSRTLENSGFVLPGSSAGQLTVNETYEQTSAGTLVVELGGTTPVVDHDVLTVVGAVSLAGRLHVELLNEFTPTVGQEFTILTTAGNSSEFDVVSGNVLEEDGILLQPVYEATGVKLEAVALEGIAVNDVEVTELGFGTTDAVFTLSLTPANESQSVQVTVQTEDGTATAADNDYIPLAPTTVTFAPGETEKQVTVKVVNDGMAEGEEYFKLVLSNPSNADIARAEGAAIIPENPEYEREDWMIVY